MKKLFFAFSILFAFSTFAQLSANMYSPMGNLLCSENQCIDIHFSASGGTAPYTFIYELSTPGSGITFRDTISSEDIFACGLSEPVGKNNGSSFTAKKFILYNNQLFLPGMNTELKLISVSDANSTQIINQFYVVYVIPPLPQIIIPTQSVCEGAVVTLKGPEQVEGRQIVQYMWYNGITNGQPFVTHSSSYYGFEAYDNMGCRTTGNAYIEVNPLPKIPTATIDSAYCNDGKISLSNLEDDVTYSWGLSSFSSELKNVTSGDYLLRMSKTNTGCYNWNLYTIPQSKAETACGEISGRVYYDMNKNCSLEGGEYTVANRVLIANPGNHVAITNLNGEYLFRLPDGTYTIEEANSLGNCSSPFSVTLDKNNRRPAAVNFFDTLDINYDVKASLSISQVRPGFGFYVDLVFSNTISNQVFSNEKAWLVIPSSVKLEKVNVPYTSSNDTIYFALDANYTKQGIYLSFLANNVVLGQELTMCTGIIGKQAENQLANNVACNTVTVVGSYDPNDKRMFLNNVEHSEDILLSDETLDYVIRFQNTGTADAINIYVLDTISENLDLASFQLLTTSHTSNVTYLGNRVFKFDFPNIHLPDSTTNELLSHGYIHYRIKQAKSNAPGTLISNTAYIYFDFNPAVVTNTTTNRIHVQVAELNQLKKNNLSIFPNPVEDKLTIQSDETIQMVRVMNLEGKTLQIIQVKDKSTTLDLNQLNSGVYILEIQTQQGLQRTKFIMN